jgi:phospholipid-binding lipoprotein MlaA
MTTVRGAFVAVAAGTLLVGCSTVQTPSKEDPLEGFNRTVFKVNDKVDRAVFRPVAKGYNAVLPQPVRTSISNFFSNIGDVTVAANLYAQGNVAGGTESVMRVVINTVFGLGGLFDVATQAKLPKHQADFGMTLGHYGVPAGPYLVLPFFGPSTVRDATGLIVDRFADPTTYIKPDWLSYTLFGVHAISLRASYLNATDLLADAALDPYSFVRNGYLQRRHYLLGQTDGAALPNYGDDSDDDTAAAPQGASGAAAPDAASGTAAKRSRKAPDDVGGGQNLPAGRFMPGMRF